MSDRAEIPEFVLMARLRSDVAFYGIVGDRVFHQGIPAGRSVEYPSVVVRLVNGGVAGKQPDGKSLMQSTIEFAIFDDDFSRCKLTANRLFAAVNGFTSGKTFPSIQRCRLSESGETDDPIIRQDGLFLYGVSQTYAVQWIR